jgi:hypothetical protein
MVRHVENLTIKELLTEYFTQKGYPVGPGTSKYTSFILPDGNKVFLGKSGAIRKGTSISSSLSYTDHYKGERLEKIREIVKAGRDQLKNRK